MIDLSNVVVEWKVECAAIAVSVPFITATKVLRVETVIAGGILCSGLNRASFK